MFRLLARQHLGEPITIVLDNAAYQKCGIVQELAAELGITLLFLPSYSPNLNLIERLWKFVKKQSLNNVYYETFDAFKVGISHCLNNLSTQYFNDTATLMTPKFQMFENDQIMAG